MPIQAGITVHDDTKHSGSAKRDAVNGVAGLDISGNVIGIGSYLTLVRNTWDNISLSDRYSTDKYAYFHRIGVDNWAAYLKVLGVWSSLLHDGLKDVANGIAGLDASAEITSRLAYEDVANGVPTLNANIRLPQTKIGSPIWDSGTDIYHQYTVDEAVTVTTYEKKFTLTLAHLPSSTLKIAWDQKAGGAGGSAIGVIYRNGSIVGVEKNTGAVSVYAEQIDQISGWSVGDTLELWGKNPAGTDYAWFKDLRILYDDGTAPITNS